MNETWYEYLELMNNMIAMPGMYGLDERRSKLHRKLIEYYKDFWSDNEDEFIPERFNEICHNLDRVIGFRPPLKRYDSLKPYVSEIDRRMVIGDLKQYVLGRVDKKPFHPGRSRFSRF